MRCIDEFSLSRECVTKFGDGAGKEVWDAINSVFDVLPLAAVIDDKVKLMFKYEHLVNTALLLDSLPSWWYTESYYMSG